MVQVHIGFCDDCKAGTWSFWCRKGLLRGGSLLVVAAAEPLALILVAALIVLLLLLLTPRTLDALSSLTSGHIGTSLAETTNGGVRVELHLGTETVLLLLATLKLETLVTPTTSSTVVLLTELVTHLATATSTSKLATLLVTRVQIATDDALVELGTRNVAQAGYGLGVKVVLNKGKTTGGPEKVRTARMLRSHF